MKGLLSVKVRKDQTLSTVAVTAGTLIDERKFAIKAGYSLLPNNMPIIIKNGMTEKRNLFANKPTEATSNTAIPISNIMICDIFYTNNSLSNLMFFALPAITNVAPGSIT